MKGSQILLAANPKGVFLEGIVSGTPKPGTVMELKRGVEPVGGRHTWEPFGATAASSNNGVAADGDQRLIAVLLEDHLQGKTYADAYASGSRCFLYCPIAGEELNMLVEDVAGTGDAYAIGDLLMVDDGTGKLLDVDSDAQSEPFIVMETVAALEADALVWCMFTGY